MIDTNNGATTQIRYDSLPDAAAASVSLEPQSNLRSELGALLNRYSLESRSDTPDFVLAEFIFDALTAFDRAVQAREVWYGRPRPGAGISIMITQEVAR